MSLFVLYTAIQLSALGLTWIAMYGTIFSPIRNWFTSKFKFFKDLLSCSQCTGFWSGLFFAVPIMITMLTRDFDPNKIQHLLEALVVYTLPLQTSAFAFISEILAELVISNKALSDIRTKTEQLKYYREVAATMTAYEKLVPTCNDTTTITPTTHAESE